jgi:hypothetical protein
MGDKKSEDLAGPLAVDRSFRRTRSQSQQFLLNLVDQRANVGWRTGPEDEAVSKILEARLN